MKPRASQKSRSGLPHQPTIGQRWIARTLCAMSRVSRLTQRLVLRESEAIPVIRAGPVIFAIWHNRLGFSVAAHRHIFRTLGVNRTMAGLVSASRDGALLAAVLEGFGIHPVRGSTSRRGPQALVELRSCAQEGFDLAITPDGPRGPRYRVQSGVIALARVTGLPIIPTACNTRWRLNLRSWDRFQIPLPFGRWEILFGEPLRVERDDETSLERSRLTLEERLRALTCD